MKTLFALLFVASFSSQALTINSSVQFIGADTSADTNVCIVAAQSGVKSEKHVVSHNVESTLCNGETVYNFSNKFQKFSNKTVGYAKL